METKAFDEDFDHCKKNYCRTPFAEQFFAEHLLIEHLSMAASKKLKIIQFNRS